MKAHVLLILKKGETREKDLVVVMYDGGYYRTGTRKLFGTEDKPIRNNRKRYGPVTDTGCYFKADSLDEFMYYRSPRFDETFRKWESMHSRRRRYESGRGYECYVCDEWYNYIAFAKWYDSQSRVDTPCSYELDKDLFGEDSHIYSPETCCLIPKEMNLFVRIVSARRIKERNGSFFYYYKGKKVFAESKEKAVSLLRNQNMKEAMTLLEIYGESIPERTKSRLVQFALDSSNKSADNMSEKNSILRIKECCKEHGVKQKALMSVLGLTESSLSTAIANDRFTARDLCMIADAIGVNVSELFKKMPEQFIAIVRKGGETFTFEDEYSLKKWLCPGLLPIYTMDQMPEVFKECGKKESSEERGQ